MGEIDVARSDNFHAGCESVGDSVFAEVFKSGRDLVPHGSVSIKSKYDLTSRAEHYGTFGNDKCPLDGSPDTPTHIHAVNQTASAVDGSPHFDHAVLVHHGIDFGDSAGV